ncbi:hypothetical protein BX666DRAFT_1849656 [Dichotomocladium elegans]|nr:hypothetical protein BX666DRAFT_1849656 [Dichotomocladium elegans]
MNDANFTLPNGAEKDIYGPDANKLFVNNDLYNRIVYPNVHPTSDDWEVVDESQARSYLPEGKTRKVTLGVKTKETTSIPLFGTESLSKTMTTKFGHVINTGGSIWGLGFAPKRPNGERDPHMQYLAVSGFRGTEKEHHAQDEEIKTGTYLNAIQIWKVKLSIEDQTQPPVLELCLLNDYGPIKSMEWCPYGVYEEEVRSKHTIEG